MSRLSQILAPHSPADFWQNTFGREVLHIPGSPEKANQWQALMGFEDLNTLMHFREGYSYQLIHQLQKYTFHPPLTTRESQEQVQYLFQQGASLVMEQVDQQHATLGRFCDEISAELACRTAFNLYLSYPDEAAFRLHYDTHDLFVLHLQGRKKWEFYGETLPYPTNALRHIHEPIPQTCKSTCILEPGDVLYVPKGHWHQALAVPNPQPSLHLTLGIYGPTGLDLFDFLKQSFEKHSTAFRAPFQPLPWSGNETASLEALKQELIQHLSGDTWQADFAAYLRHKSPRRAGLSLPYVYWRTPDQIPDHAHFERVAVPYTLSFHTGQLQLRYDHKVLVFAPAAEPVLRYLLETPRFDRAQVSTDLPQFPWAAVKAVLLPLLQDGLYTLHDH